MSARSLSTLLDGAVVVTVFVLIVRILQLRLQKRFRYFLAYLFLDVVGAGFAWVFGTASQIYYFKYTLSQPLRIALYLLVTKEVYAPLYALYPGLRLLSRPVLRSAIGLGLLSGLLSVPMTYSKWSNPAYHCALFLLMELKRDLMIGLSGFLVGMLLGLRKFPIDLRTNTVSHVLLYSTLCVTGAASTVATLLVHDKAFTAVSNCILLATSISCYVAWSLLLRSEGNEPATQNEISLESELLLLQQMGELRNACRRLMETCSARASGARSP